jgi:ABC-2 type transport system permease protein
MHATSIIFRRELAAYLRSPVGYLVAAVGLLIVGILFQAQALGGGAQLSADVLRKFFYNASGFVMVAGLVLAIRLVAEERQQHTIVLLNTSPVRDVEIVAGKFLSAFVFLAGMTMLTLYMPLLIKVNGKISIGEVVVGYLGLLLLGAASLAMGLFASALARQQLVAAAIGGVLLVFLIVMYPLAQKLDPPLRSVFEQLALHNLRFQGGFQQGVLNLKDVVYYLSVTYFFLLLATKTLEAKRWQ